MANPKLQPQEEKKLSQITALIKPCSSFIALAFREWILYLTEQPIASPFTSNAEFKNEVKRAARLVVIVIIISIIVLGGANLLFAKTAPLEVTGKALKVICASFLIALAYKLFAGILRIPISLNQVLLVVLFTCVPWLPVFNFLWGVGLAAEGLVVMAFSLGVYLSLGYMIYNLGKALIVITKCPVRVWLSLLIPLIASVSYILFR